MQHTVNEASQVRQEGGSYEIASVRCQIQEWTWDLLAREGMGTG